MRTIGQASAGPPPCQRPPQLTTFREEAAAPSQRDTFSFGNLVEATEVPEDDEAGDGIVVARAAPDERVDKKAQQDWHYKVMAASVAIVALLIVVIVVVVISLQRGNDEYTIINTPPSIAPSRTPSTVPSYSPTGVLDDLLINHLPNHTLTSLQDPFSFQSQAYDWLINHPNITIFSQWRQIQLFALATFYYSFQGPYWPNGLDEDWLDYTRSECDWYYGDFGNFEDDGSGGGFDEFYSMHNRNGCNDQGEYVELYLDGLYPLPTAPKLPPEIALLTTLQGIKLFNNRISNITLDEFLPSEIYQMTSLTRLSVDKNMMTGTIPTEFGLMTELRQLHLRINLITGALPSQLGLLSANLSTLWAHHLLLTGTLPTEICRLTNHWMISVDHNMLSGPLPSQLGLLSDAPAPWLFHNQFSGTIPTEIGKMVRAPDIQVYNNKLTGPIPSQLGQLGETLQQLVIYNNQLTGPIPSQLGQLSNSLYYIGAENNQLSGQLPSQLGELTQIWYLILANNTLLESSTIPSQLGMCSGLIQLDLSNNLLSGTIPLQVAALPLDGNLSSLQLDGNPNLHISTNNMGAVSAAGGGNIPEDLCWLEEDSCIFYHHGEDAILNCSLSFDCTDTLCGCYSCPCSATVASTIGAGGG